jgi:hypothetical protein
VRRRIEGKGRKKGRKEERKKKKKKKDLIQSLLNQWLEIRLGFNKEQERRHQRPVFHEVLKVFVDPVFQHISNTQANWSEPLFPESLEVLLKAVDGQRCVKPKEQQLKQLLRSTEGAVGHQKGAHVV